MFKVKPLKSHDKSRKWIFDTKIIDKLGKVYDLDIKVKVEKIGRFGRFYGQYNGQYRYRKIS